MVGRESEVELGETTPLFHSQPDSPPAQDSPQKRPFRKQAAALLLVGALFLIGSWLLKPQKVPPVYQGSAPAAASTAPLAPSLFAPFSIKDPRSLNFSGVTRPDSTPGPAFGKLREQHLPLPTNSWSQNLLYA